MEVHLAVCRTPSPVCSARGEAFRREDDGLHLFAEDDPDQPAGEFDDSHAQHCFDDGLFGHPNVKKIEFVELPAFPIDQRINPDNDSDSDGIDFPLARNYTLNVYMRRSVYLQYVNVPASNVILLYVIVHSPRGRMPYHSKMEPNPVVKDFLADDPTMMFQVQLMATEDGREPRDVTLKVVGPL